ncbi:hypothetical protein PtB15_7B338 [Puccinia triticina]|nr:hypothetical protein PtB15_7B338 [Puccinia triticina]
MTIEEATFTLHAGLLSVLALSTPPRERPAPPDQPVLFASPQAVKRRCSVDKPLSTNLPRLGLAQLGYHNALAILPIDLRLSTQLSHLAAAELRLLLEPFGPHVQPSLTSTATPHSPQPNSSSSQKLQAHSRLHIQTTPGHSRDIPSASCPTRPEAPRRRQLQCRAQQDHPADRSGRLPRSDTAPSPPWPNPRAARAPTGPPTSSAASPRLFPHTTPTSSLTSTNTSHSASLSADRPALSTPRERRSLDQLARALASPPSPCQPSPHRARPAQPPRALQTPQ